MYERTIDPQLKSIKEAAPLRPERFQLDDDKTPNVSRRASPDAIKQVLQRSSHVNYIQEFSGKMKFEFEPISELNSMSSAYSGLFWDVNSNWIVVAFKGTCSGSDLARLGEAYTCAGTSPTEFDG